MIKVAINGFGRIGRIFLRTVLENTSMQVVAINDVAPLETMSHLFKYDSVHGSLDNHITFENNFLRVDHRTISFFNENDPEKLPWKELNIDVVIEATGLFKTYDSCYKHIQAGAKKVVLSAPPFDNQIKTIVVGVNDDILDGTEQIISNASCTTNSAAPLIQLLDQNFDVQSTYITTIHSYTTDQQLHDSPHRDLRRARAGATSIVPTTTGAAKAITKIFPHLDGKIGGCGIRVPVPDGSLTDITCMLTQHTSIEKINDLFLYASNNQFKGMLSYISDPIVSVDIIGNKHSCIFDSQLTSVIGPMVKVVGWYDNEVGYCNRLIDLILRLKVF